MNHPNTRGETMDVMQRTPLEVIMAISGSENVIVTPKMFVRLLGDLNSAMMLGQLLYWTPRTKNPQGWIYKTYADWYKEICLTKRQLTRAKDILVDREFIDVKLKQISNKSTVLHYRLLQENVMRALIMFKDVENMPEEGVSEVTKSNFPEVTKGDSAGKLHNVTPGSDKVLLPSITENTYKEYVQRVRAENTPAGLPSPAENLSSQEEVPDSKQVYADELTSQIDKLLPDKYRIGKLPKKYVSKLLVLNTIIEPDTIEDYTRWYLDVKEPTKGFTLGLFTFKDMGVEYKAACTEYKKTKKGKQTTSVWADKPADSTGAIARFKKFQESQKK